MKLEAKWEDDCCGKKDYDGRILSISSRYWPRGGSALTFDTAHPELGLHKHDDGSKPSAKSSLLIWTGDGDYETLAETDGYIEGETFEEVAAQVEAWAQEQMDKAVAILRAGFVTPNAAVTGRAGLPAKRPPRPWC
jgi:hypothetical protein